MSSLTYCFGTGTVQAEGLSLSYAHHGRCEHRLWAPTYWLLPLLALLVISPDVILKLFQNAVDTRLFNPDPSSKVGPYQFPPPAEPLPGLPSGVESVAV